MAKKGDFCSKEKINKKLQQSGLDLLKLSDVQITTDFGKSGTEKYNERFHCSFHYRFVRLAEVKRQSGLVYSPPARKPSPLSPML